MLTHDGVAVCQDAKRLVVLEHGAHRGLLLVVKLEVHLAAQLYGLVALRLGGHEEAFDLGHSNDCRCQTLAFSVKAA